MVQEDFGISARVCDNSIETLILAGCHSYGAYAAAFGMTRDNFIREVHTFITRGGVRPLHFIALWEVNILDGAVQSPKLIDAVVE